MPAELRVDLHGTGVGDAFVQLEQTKLDFGSVLIGKTRTLKMTLTNIGNAPLTIERLSIDGSGAYKVASGSTCKKDAKVKAGESCVIAVAFRPAETGKANATLTIASDAKDSPSEIALHGQGKGEASLVATPVSIDFGEVVIGDESEPQTVTIGTTARARRRCPGWP